MNCQSFENVVVDLARTTPLDASVRDAALAHVACCDGCGRRLAQEKLLTGGLQALATEMKSTVAPDHLQQNLITAFRQQRSAPQFERTSHSWRYLAVAAAILFAVALGIASYKMTPAPPADSKARLTPPIAVPVAGMPAPPVKELSHTPTVRLKPRAVVATKQRNSRPSPAPSAQSTFVTVVVGSVTDPEAPEVVSPFMAVGYSNPGTIQEGAQVVRVELPRYAMARFGLPVNMDRYDERVKADVWLSADGFARAIRFVQ